MKKRVISMLIALVMMLSIAIVPTSLAQTPTTVVSSSTPVKHTVTMVAESLPYSFSRTKWSDRSGDWISRNGCTTSINADNMGEISKWIASQERTVLVCGDDGKLGVVNAYTGKVIVPIIYDDVSFFNYEGYAQVRLNGKVGLVNRRGEVIVPIVYDAFNMTQEYNSFDSPITKDGLIIAHSGSNLTFQNTSMGIIASGGKQGVVNAVSGEVVVPLIYDHISMFSGGLARVRMGSAAKGEFGYVDMRGEVAISIKYNYAEAFQNGYAIVGIGDGGNDFRSNFKGKYGVIDTSGNVVVPIEYNEIGTNIVDGSIIAKSNGKWGVVHVSGEIVVTFEYDHINGFSVHYASFVNGIAQVHLGDKRGAINTSGEFIIPLIYNNLHWSVSSNTITAATGRLITEGPQRGLFINDKMGVIDMNGDVIIPVIYDNMHSLDLSDALNGNGFVRVYRGGTWYLFDVINRVELPFEADNMGWQGDDGFRQVSKDGKTGLVNSKGEVVVPIIYDDIGWEFKDGLLPVGVFKEGADSDSYWRTRCHWGFVNTDGELVIPVEYDYVENFREGFAAVAKLTEVIEQKEEYDGKEYTWEEEVYKYGFINTKGEVVVPFIYDLVRNFENGFAQVGIGDRRWGDDPEFNGEWGLVNTKGELVIPVGAYGEWGFWFDEFGLSMYNSKGKQGVINTSNEVLISVDYSDYTYDVDWNYDDYLEWENARNTICFVGNDSKASYYWVKEDGVIRIIAISPANTYPTPEGYNDNDYQKLATFIIQNDLCWNLTDPATWWRGVTWNDEVPKRVIDIGFESDWIDVSGKLDVSDFTELMGLDLRGQNVDEVNLSNTPKLEFLWVSGGLTYNIDVSANFSLKTLYLHHNQLTDISSLENLENLEYVNVSNNYLNLEDPAIQLSIAKIQATIDKNGGEFIYTPQRTPICEYCDPSMTSCECLFFECCGLVYFDGVYWYEICTCGGNPVTTEPPVSTTTLPHTTTTTGATTTTGTGTTVSVATTTPTVSSETTPPTTTAPATTTVANDKPVLPAEPCDDCDLCTKISKEGYKSVKGRILGTPETQIFDFIEILKYLVRINDVVEKCGNARYAALLSTEGKSSGEPKIFCGIEILKYLVGISDGKDW